MNGRDGWAILPPVSHTTDRSRQLFERSLGTMIEGGSSASRGPANFGAYPLFIERAEGPHLFDVDGNRYIDWMMSYGALPLGHAHPRVVEAVTQGAVGGFHFAAATQIEIEVAELIQGMVPNAERVRFANTGTEAVMAAIRLARGFTGRPLILKFEGHYHGWHDDVLVSSNPQLSSSLGHRADPVKIPDSSGLNRRSQEDTIVVPWNDIRLLRQAVANNPGRIAAVLTEGVMANMGVIPPAPGYLHEVQDLCRAEGILFILDETVTGFRISGGGCQQHFGLDADIATFGKALGSGLPVAAFVGRAEIMNALAWGGVLHYGTQNSSRLGLCAARASLKELQRDDGAAVQRIWETGEALCDGLREVFSKSGTEAIVQNVGPMFQILFTDRSSIDDYREYCEAVDRDKFRRFAWELFEHGVYMSPSPALHSVASLAHGERELRETLDAVRHVLRNFS